MVPKKLSLVIALVASLAGACSSSGTQPATDPQSSTGSSTEKLVIGCTPFVTNTSLLACGATDVTLFSTAATLQSTLTTQLQSIFASVSLAPDLVANQVVLTSTSADFVTLFGPQIVAPLNTVGVFATAVPFTITTVTPAVTLTANIWGQVPLSMTTLGVPAAIPPATLMPIDTVIAPSPIVLPGMTSTFSATNSATVAATSDIAATTSLAAAAMPFSFWISTPIDATAPFFCNGMLPLFCQ